MPSEPNSGIGAEPHPTVADAISEASSQERPRNVVFAAPADDPRARRPADGFVLIASAAVAGIAGWTHLSKSDFDVRIEEVFSGDLPGWVSFVFTTVFALGGIYTFGLLLAILFLTRGRLAIVRDMLLAGGLAVGLAAFLAWLAGPEWLDIFPEFLERDGTPSYPVVRLSVSVAILTVAGPYLSVPMRQVGNRVLLAMTVAAIVMTYGTLSGVIGGVATGATAAAAIHLLFGSGVGIPSKARITDGLRSIGLDPVAISYVEDQPIGATLVEAELEDGRKALVKVYGRDASDAAFVSRLWRQVWYRDSKRAVTVSSLQLVEHESLMLLEADRASIPAPLLLGWGQGDAGDAMVAMRWLEADRLSEHTTIDDDALGRCWDALLAFHAAGIAHRQIDGRRVLVLEDRALLLDLSAASMAADDLELATDIAQMLATTAVAAGTDRAIAVAREKLGPDRLGHAVPLLQTNALPASLQQDAKNAGVSMKELRAATIEATGSSEEELVQLRRVTWANVGMLVLTFVAAYTLLTSLAEIGFDTIVDQLSNAQWEWLLIAFVLAQLTNVGEYVSLTGMVDRDVPFGPTIMFRYALSFISLAVPSEAGAIAMNIRYMQRLGVPPVAAAAQGPLLTVFSKGFDIILLIITARFIGQTVDLDDIDSGPILKLLVLVLVLLVVGVVVTITVPKIRERVVPPLRQAFSAIRASVTDPRRLLRVSGGTLSKQLLFALTLAASVAAYGESISFAEAVFVNSAVSLFVGLMPVPGGIGVGEAALTAGLTTVGVPQGPALAAAISHRLVTAYLPPIYGWWTTRWLTARDYL